MAETDDKAKAESEAKAKAEAEAKAKAEAAKAAASTVGLMKVRKGDEILHVHPTTLAAHKSAGWLPV